MVPDSPGKSAATCRVCDRQLTVEEFRACAGVGHYCTTHLPADAAKTKRKSAPRKRSTTSSGSKRGRTVTDSGVVEYSCKAQFASTGVMRRGKLTSEHPSAFGGGVVFVHEGIGYGPGEIVTLFIKDPDGRRLAERTGFECHS